MKKITGFTLAFVLIFSAAKAIAKDTTVIKSPNGLIHFKLFLKDKALHYAITFRGVPVIDNSPLIVTVDNNPVTANTKTGEVIRYSIHEEYPWLGVHAKAVNHCNGARISLLHQSVADTLDIRVFNDGCAFRIILPGLTGGNRVADESTVFTIPAGSTLWYHDLYMHYEGVHVKRQIDSVADGEWMAPPATYKLPQGYYASVTESNLVNYSGMALQADGQNGLVLRLAHHQPTSYPYRLRYSPEDTLRLRQPAGVAGTIITPWRVVIVGKDLNAMVNNDIVHNLCPPPDKIFFPEGIKTSWIKPGRAVWKYLDGGGAGTPEVMKKFTDAAAALGFEHNILEGFWTRWTDDQLRDLVNYSKQKNVGIWLWKHSKSLRNKEERLAFFKHCHDLGVTGLKIDFFDHEAKEVIDLYSSILEEAAEYKLLLNFHGANKPAGLERTWPNELTREGVKGMESSKLMDRATHETTIPFTRFVAGQAEYTVMHFGDRRRNTTRAHQIASTAILSAPLLTYATNPESILANPAVEVIKAIPSVWDETIVLPGSEIGELAAYARRKGNTWFVAVMNGTSWRHVKIPLQFLKGKYRSVTVNDDPANPASVIMKKVSYKAGDAIELDLAPGGGFMGQFMK